MKITKNLIYWAFLSLTVILFLFVLIDRINFERQTISNGMERGMSSTMVVEKRISVLLDSIIVETQALAARLSEMDRINDVQLKKLIKSSSHSPTYISGITVAFESFAFSADKRLYAPYYQIDTDDFMNIGEIYDYTSDTLATAVWYSHVIEENRPVWSEPYYAKGAQMVVADYGVPFYESGNKGQIRGVVSTTIPLRTFSGYLYSMSLGNTGYGFMVSALGNYIVHPVTDYILSENFIRIGEELGISDEVDEILREESGYIRSSKLSKHGTLSIFFMKIPSTNWKLVSVFVLNDLMPGYGNIKTRKIHLWMVTSSLVFVLLIGFLQINGLSDRELWLLAIILSFLIVPNIVNVWRLNLNDELIIREEKETDILSRENLEQFINKQNTILQQSGQEDFISIPTGIYIEEMEFEDSYNLNISGVIWQKYPNKVLENTDPGYYMPQISPFAEAAYSELIRRDSLADHTVFTWMFRNTFRMHFDYSRFPFDLREVSLQILHPVGHNLMLVPDLGSYKIIEPRMKPAVNDKIVLPTAKIILSNFSFTFRNYRTTFGRDQLTGLDEVPVMEFNILIKRRFINAFVTHVIPIIVVALLLFLVLFSSTRRKSSMSGISSLGGVETSAAFFFVLVLAHIDLRKSVDTPDISYMETFYFLMYLMLALVTINIVVFTKSERPTIFDYKDNFWFKLAYWPILLSLIYIVTLFYFYC